MYMMYSLLDGAKAFQIKKKMRRKNFVIQTAETPWNLSSIYKKVHSVVLANKIYSPKEYFRVLYL